MLIEQAVNVQKEWNSVCNSVIYDKPKFIACTQNKMLLSNLDTISDILHGYNFTAEKYIEEDGSVTLSLNEIDIIENGNSEKEAKKNLGNAILEYSLDYYNDYDLYSHAPNRKKHIPYIFKALIIDDPDKIGEIIQCQSGKN